MSSAHDKTKLFAKNFSNNSNLDDSGISLPVFLCRTHLKLHISVNPKRVKKVIMNLDLSNSSGPDCIPVVVLKICESELSFILAELFNKCVKESCFQDCLKVISVVPVFKNAGERSTAKNHRPVTLLYVVSKVFEKLVSNKIVHHLEKFGLFSDFHYGFRSSRSTEFQVRYLVLLLLFSVINGMEWFCMESLHKNTGLFNAGVPYGSILGHTLFLLYINDISDFAICDITMYADHITILRHLICGNNLNWLLNLNLIYDTPWTWVRSGLLISILVKLVLFDRSNNNGSIDVKMDWSVPEEK